MRRSGSDIGENAFKKRSYSLRSVNVVDVTGEYDRTPLHVALLRKRNYLQYRNVVIRGWPSLLPLEYGEKRMDSLIFHKNETVADASVDVEQVRKLIRAGSNVNAVDSKGNSCLHYAVENEDCCKPIELLIDAGAKLVSVNNLGDTPLLTAVKVNNLEAVDTLIKCGANIDASNNHGDTCLHLAQDNAMVSLLARNGAKIESLNNLGDTPLLTAVRVNNLKAVIALIDNGANIDTSNNRGEKCLHLAMDDSMVCLLLCNGCSTQINITSQCGCSPIFFAIAFCQVKTLKQMIRAGADVNLKHNECNVSECQRSMRTPLREAIEKNRYEVVEALLENGANLNEICDENRSILWHASRFGYYPPRRNELLKKLPSNEEDEKYANIVHLIITRGVDVCNEVEAFKAVIKHGNLKGIHSFLNEFYRKKVQIPAQQSLLHLAVHNPRDDVLNFFIVSNFHELDQVDDEGYTAFHMAVKLSDKKRAKELLDYGADINTVNNTGQTVLDTAFSLPPNFRVQLVQFLLSYGSFASWRVDMTHLNVNSFSDMVYRARAGDEVKEIIKYIALNQSVGHCIAPAILKWLKEACYFYFYRQLYKDCKIEIRRLRSSIIHDSITVYDFLTKSNDRYIRNENLARELSSENLYRRFPLYANLIRHRFAQSQRELERFLESGRSLSRILGLDYSTFHQIYENILRRLNPVHLLSLRQI